MAGRIILILQLFIISLLVACRSGRPVVSPVAANVTAENYINIYRDLAVSEMRRTGVPASITLAQGMVESDYGRSTLARVGNNHFGIKCHNTWSGPTMTHHDDRRNECFRKYAKVEDSFRDHSDFLRNTPRYSFLFNISLTDYKGWAHGLKKAGYATNPNYASMLIRKIEENNLSIYDLGYTASGSKPQVRSTESRQAVTVDEKVSTVPIQQETSSFGAVLARAARIGMNNGIRYIIVRSGETIAGVAEEFQMLKFEVVRFNDLSDNSVLVPGQILYLDAKKEKAQEGMDIHIAEAGETMYQISQKYGIKLKSLRSMNRMGNGSEPVAGQKIWLRELMPVMP